MPAVTARLRDRLAMAAEVSDIVLVEMEQTDG